MSHQCKRYLVLALSGICGMVGLGWSAAMTVTIRDGWGIQLEYFVVASVVAALAALFTLLFTLIWLQETRLNRSLPFIYAVSLFPTVAVAWLDTVTEGLSAVIPAIFSVIIASAVASHLFRDPRFDSRGNFTCPECAYDLRGQVRSGCPECDYDLSGCITRGCPECGWGREIRKA